MASRNAINELNNSNSEHEYESSDVIPWIKARIPIELYPYTESVSLFLLALFPLTVLLLGIFLGNTLLPILFWVLIVLDFLISSLFAFPMIRRADIFQRINEKLPKFFQINTKTYFSHYSLLYRFCRLLGYSLFTGFFTFGLTNSDFILIMSMLFLCILIYTIIASIYQLDPTKNFFEWYRRHHLLVYTLVAIIAISLLGVLARLYHVYGIGTWDEGWYADISARMAHQGNWLLPLYYEDSTNQILLFDKPPFLFWLGAIAIQIFGNISLAVKLPMSVLSGLLGLFGFLIYHHQRCKNQLNLIPNYSEYEPQSTIDQEPPESELQITDGFATGIIFGLLISLAWFVVFYGQTSYIDPAVIGISALTAVVAIKCIDHLFYGNYRKSFIYLLLTGIINAIDLFSKAWQGLIVGPPIAIYFFIRFFQHFIPKDHFRAFWATLRPKMFKISKILETEVYSLFGALLTIIIFTFRQKTIYDGLTIPGTNIVLDLWGTIIGIVMFFAINAFLQSIIQTKHQDSHSSFDTNVSNSLSKLNPNGHGSVRITDSADNLSKPTPLLQQKSIFRSVFYIVIALILGIVGGLAGQFGFDFVFSRFYGAITSISTTYLGGSSAGSTSANVATEILPIQSSLILGRWVTSFFSIISGLLFGIGAVWLSGILLLVCLALFANFSQYLLKRFFNISDSSFKLFFSFPSWVEGIVLDLSLIIPLTIVILPFIYWGFFLLFQGELFNRDFFYLTISGIVLILIAYIVSLGVLQFFVKVYRKSLQKISIPADLLETYSYTWEQRYKKILLFTNIMLIIIVLSFAPFMWWIQYLDQNLSALGYAIRKAGELYIDPNSPIQCVPDPKNPGQNCLTYTWIFFDFYTNWRYTFPTSYNVADSLGGFIGPLFISCFPFFLAGIIALYKRKDYANLCFYLSWFLLVFFIFIPATFQLNYYYLAAFFPYFGIVASGIFFSMQKLRTTMHFKDKNERLIVILPLLLLLIVSQVIPYLLQIDVVFNNSTLRAQFLASLILVVGLFIVLALFFVRSIPGMFVAMLVTFNIQRYVWLNGWGQLDAQFLLINIALIAIPLYLLRDRIPLRSLFFIGLIVFSGAITASWWINWKSGAGEDGYASIGQFIVSHGGAYNGSYWVYPEAGTRYAIRYYTNGYDAINVRSFDPNSPFSSNSATYMQIYIQNNPNLKFFIILDWTGVFNSNQTPSENAYPIAYSWLKSHWILANTLLNIPDDHYVHLYVKPGVLTSNELHTLNLTNTIGQQNNSLLSPLNLFNVPSTYWNSPGALYPFSFSSRPRLSNVTFIENWIENKIFF